MHITSPATTDPLPPPKHHGRTPAAFPLEAAVWIAGLAVLAAIDPAAGTAPDLCLFRALGVGYCPGCGLGRSVAYLLHGSVAASVQAHPLGIPAILLLTARIFRLLTSWIRASSTEHTPDGRVRSWRVFSS